MNESEYTDYWIPADSGGYPAICELKKKDTLKGGKKFRTLTI
jgi:hypothetical protein